jgi:hypothetical protein
MKLTMPVALSLSLLAGCVGSAPLTVPKALEPGAGETLALVVPARGVQIYQCRISKDGEAGEWAFVAPDADLFDARGKPIGRHGAGPFWEASDGSRVTGTVKARADAPAAGAVPWLLLDAKSSGSDGAFSGVTSVQRVNTAGGQAPTAPCTAGNAGVSARVPYTADYYFYTAR